MTKKLSSLLVVFCCTVLGSSFVRADAVEDEINALIDVVEASNCEFERNGDRHDAVSAADHLRLKFRRGKRYATSTEKFIDRLASESSWSGRDYKIICEGQEQTSNAWLHAALQEMRQAP